MNLHTFLYKVYSYPTRFIADYFMGCSQDALVSRYGTGVLKYPNHFILKNGIDAKKYIYSAELREKIRKKFYQKVDGFWYPGEKALAFVEKY